VAIDVHVPDAEEGAEIEVVALHVAAGATVAEGDVVAEIATDKANVDVPAPAGGTVAEIFVAEGDVLEATEALMRIDD
jgi:pyruvate/2-oxoglutarate dehydrogenase complex dihydrolipoamide acyltransferase (E2) component